MRFVAVRGTSHRRTAARPAAGAPRTSGTTTSVFGSFFLRRRTDLPYLLRFCLLTVFLLVLRAISDQAGRWTFVRAIRPVCEDDGSLEEGLLLFTRIPSHSAARVSGDRYVRGPAWDRPGGFKRSYMLLGGGKESFGFRVLWRRKP